MTDRYTVERIMEIIAWVVESRKPIVSIGTVEVTELSERGYTDGEISAALSWIIERGGSLTSHADCGSFRMLHAVEAEVITAEAWGLLISYRNLGFLSNSDIEQIIERCMIMAGETLIDIPEIRALVAVFVMHQGPQQLDGSRKLLSGKETVN
ncbi:MAG: DUF494 family protein [Flavobacteriales bacterium]|nr:MAG: Protein Smg [Chlorobi bacterium OLB6]MBE2265220.1 DUF494 family protein [Flavobacteriales bacterium]MBV6463416.1 hypothetical protein [Chlorobiota bacterium]MBW7854121.1 DUF494 family protein [Candidatus Kapabacteria bacterium]MCC6330695.1 DUF494 family protein [Ignavibacteria bacterium]